MPVKIHNKEYFTVAERLNELNTNSNGNYTLTSEMIYFKDGVVVIKATLQIGENTFTGHAQEKEDASMINKTSFIECAETSSWGRALAAAGYVGTEIASADEVATAIKNQSDQPIPEASNNVGEADGVVGGFATLNQTKYIKSLCKERDIDDSKYDFDEMTKTEASDIIKEVMETKKVVNKQRLEWEALGEKQW